MFEQPISYRVFADALVRAVLLWILSDLLITGYFVRVPVSGTGIIVVATLVPVFSSWSFSKGETSNKRILGFALWSFLLGTLVYVCLMVLSVVFSIRVFPTDYMSNASALLFFVVMPWSLLATTILRIVSFGVFLLKNIKKGS